MSSSKKISDKPLTPRHAWQPLTPRGVAAFANASFARLFFVQFIVAAAVALAVIWFLRIAWFPVVAEAVQRLPDAGVIQQGILSYGAASPQLLSENARLAIVVDVEGTREAGRVADVLVIFGKETVAFCGLFGCRSVPYDRTYVIGFNRSEVEPAWGAWQWPVLALAGIATMIVLFVLWWALALLYLPLVKLLAFFADHAVAWSGAWKLSAAALLPGGLLVALSLLLYGFGAVDLLRFALLYVLHLLCGLIFVITSPWFLPPVGSAGAAKNPFRKPASES